MSSLSLLLLRLLVIYHGQLEDLDDAETMCDYNMESKRFVLIRIGHLKSSLAYN